MPGIEEANCEIQKLDENHIFDPKNVFPRSSGNDEHPYPVSNKARCKHAIGIIGIMRGRGQFHPDGDGPGREEVGATQCNLQNAHYSEQDRQFFIFLSIPSSVGIDLRHVSKHTFLCIVVTF